MPPPPLVLHSTSHSPERPLLEPDFVPPVHTSRHHLLGNSPIHSGSFPPLGSSADSVQSAMSLVSHTLRPSPPPLTATSTTNTPASIITPRPNSAAGPSQPIIISPSSLSPTSASGSLSPPNAGLIRVKSFPHTADLLGNASETLSSRAASREASSAPPAPEIDVRMAMDLSTDDAVITVVPRETSTWEAATFTGRRSPMSRGREEQGTIRDTHPRSSSRLDFNRDTISSGSRAAPAPRRTFGNFGIDADFNRSTASRGTESSGSEQVNVTGDSFAGRRWSELGSGLPYTARARNLPERLSEASPSTIEFTSVASASTIRPLRVATPTPAALDPPITATRAASPSVPIHSPSQQRRDETRRTSRLPGVIGVARTVAAQRAGTRTSLPIPRSEREAWDDPIHPRIDDAATIAASFASSTARLRARTRESMPVSYDRLVREDNPGLVDEPMPPSPIRHEDEDVISNAATRADSPPSELLQAYGMFDHPVLRLPTGPDLPGRRNPASQASSPIATVPAPRPTAAFSFDLSASPPYDHVREATVTPLDHRSLGSLREQLRSYASPTDPYPIPGARQPSPPGLNRSISVGTAFRAGRLRERMARLDALRTQGDGLNRSSHRRDLPPWLEGHPVADGAGASPGFSPIEPNSARSGSNSLSTGGLFDYNMDSFSADMDDPMATSQPESGGEEGSGAAAIHRNVQNAAARRLHHDPISGALNLRRPRERLLAEYGGSERPALSRLEIPTSRATNSRDSQGGFGEFDASTGRLWGEIPVDTVASGLHDPLDPFASFRRDRSRPGGFIVSDPRVHRLPRGFVEPERNPYTNPTLNLRRFGIPDAAAGGGSTTTHPFFRAAGAGSIPFHTFHRPDLHRDQDNGYSYPQGLAGPFGVPPTNLGQGMGYVPIPPSESAAHWTSAALGLDRGDVGRRAPGLFNLAANLEFRSDMGEGEKRAVVQLVIKMVARMPGQSRMKAAESTLENTTYGQMGEREGMGKDVYCSVCHDEYEDDTKITITPCKHMYHQDCLSIWLNTPNTSSCPMCRRDLAALACVVKLLPTKSLTDALPLWMPAT